MPTLPKISPEIYKAYQDEISKNSSVATARRKSISLNRFFNWAQSTGKIPENPIKPESPREAPPTKSFRPKVGFKTWTTLGATGVLSVLIFLIANKLNLPIPYKINFAQESLIQTQHQQSPTGGTGQAPSGPTTIPANGAVIAGWNLFTKLTFADQNGIPQVGSQAISFKIYNSATGGDPLYTSQTQTVTTDANGSTLISLSSVPTDLFFQNDQLFLEPQIGSASANVRIPVSTANTSTNLNGFSAANPDFGAGPQTIPVINSDGALVLASQAPAIKANEGNLLVEGQAVTIKSADGSNGNIEFNPDGAGYAHFLFEGSRGNFLNAQGPNLTTGSLYYGMVPNNATGYDLIKLVSGSPTMTTRFAVDAMGDTYAGGDLVTAGDLATGDFYRLTKEGVLENINGYTQQSGNFTVVQNPEDYGVIYKGNTALSDVLNVTLNEDMIPGSHYAALTVNRFGGDENAHALVVNGRTLLYGDTTVVGDSVFDGQVQLGNYLANPTAIGEGSIVYNATDGNVYYWNGSTWIQLATGTSSFSGSFADLTSGTNTTAAMIVGSGASLTFSGTGTITASDVTCTGCISNSKLANSSITINSSGILTGGGAVSLGGTLNLAATEADTLATVTGRGASTGTQVSLNGGITSTGDLTLSPIGNVNFYSTSNKIDPSGNLTIAGTTTFGGLTYTWPGSIAANNYVLQTQTNGTLAWVDPTVSVSSSIYWTQANGSLFPKNNSVDVLIGANSTGSAKFAFTGVNGGLPTATISGNVANLATYLTGNGTLQVTNMAHLTIGGGTTGGIDFASPITSGIWNGSTIAANYGGTGFSSYTLGDILYADSTSSLARLNDVATGNVLISGGVGAAPTYGKVVLGTHTTGNYVSTITGTANEITASAATGDVTLSIPSDFRAPGTVNAVNGIYTGATAGTQRIDSTGNLTNIGTTQINGVTYAWPGTATTNYVLQSQNTGASSTLAWVDPNVAVASTIYWTSANGALFPKNNTLDVLIGSDSTTSAKFAFTGVNTGGLPTASIAGDVTNVATYLTGDGNLATTNARDLTLGGSTTGNVVINSRGNAALTANGPNLTTTGTFTLPNSNTLTGVANYLQNSQGYSVGGGTTYYFDGSGNINANAGTFASTVTIPNSNTLTGVVNFTELNNGLSVGGGTTYYFDKNGIINAANITGTTINATTAINTGAGVGTQRIDASGNLTNIGTTQVNGVTYTWPASATANYVLQSGNTGSSSTLSWVDPATAVASSIFWTQDAVNGVLYPKNNSVDVLVGSNATKSAKFAFTGVDGGLPTASIAGNIANVATYLTGNGNLQVTNMADLTLGGATTGRVVANSPFVAASITDTGLTASKGLFTDTNKQLTSTGVLGTDQGGTGLNSYTTGDLVYASATNTLTQLADVATGNALISGGVGVAPSWGKIVLGTHTTGNYVSQIFGTTNQITASAAVGDVTLSIPSDFRAPGTVNATNGLYTGATAGTQRIDSSGNLTSIGTTQINGVIYTWPGSATAGYVLQSGNTGASSTLSWVDPSAAVASSIFWAQDAINGVLYPKNNSVDVLIGSGATTSAKFAFIGVDGGLPTASIAGNVANVATYLTGNGNLATTNMRDLTLGGSTTGNVIINSRGSNTLTANGADVTILGNLAVNGGNITSTASTLVINAGGNVDVQDVLNADSLTTDTGGVTIAASQSYTGLGAVTLSSGGGAGLTLDSASNTLTIDPSDTTLTASGLATFTTAASLSMGSTTTLTLGGNSTINGGTGSGGTLTLVSTTNGTKGNIQFFNTTNSLSPTGDLTIAGNASASGNLTLAGGARSIQTTSVNPLTIGGTTTGNITLSPSNDVAGGFVAPNTANNTDLGTSTNYFRNIFGGVINAVTSINTGAGSGTPRIDTSGNLTSIGTTQLNGVTYTWPASATANYVLQSGNTGSSSTLTWVDPAAAIASNIYWTQANGALFPKNNTVDVLIGANSTTSAKFAFTNVLTGLPTASIAGDIANVATYITGDGNLATTNMRDLTLGGSSTGNVVINSRGSAALTANGADLSTTGKFTFPNSNILTGVASYLQNSNGYSVGAGTTYHFDGSGNLVANDVAANSGNLTTTSSTGNLFTGATTINIGPTGSGASSIVLSGGSGDTGCTLNGANGNFTCSGDITSTETSGTQGFWSLGSGALYPSNNTVDILVGANSTTSAKFAFTGVDGGLPTASIAGNIANVATYLTGNGNLATTNMRDLTLGGSTTGNVVLNSRGSAALTANGPDVTILGDLAVNGGDITSTGGLNITPGGALVVGATGQTTTLQGSTTSITSTGAGNDITLTSADQIILNAGSTIELQDNTNVTGNVDATGTASISGSLTFKAGTGTIQTTTASLLVLGGNTTGNITLSPSNDVAGGNVSPNVANVTDLGTSSKYFRNIFGGVVNAVTSINTGAGSGTARIDASGNLTSIGTTQINGVTYTWPGSATAGYVLQSGNTGASSTLSWVDPAAAAASSIYWTQDAVNGVLYPKNSSVDVLIGSSATTSAKFAFIGVDGGLPTASIAGNIANVATYLTGNGNLATTNMRDLTLGGSTTGNVIINSRGSTALTANGANLTAAGNLAVNGGNITSTASTLVINAGGNVDIQDILNADSLTTDTGGVTIAASQAYSGLGAVTLSSGGGAGLTLDSASNTLTIDSSDTTLTASGLATFTTAPSLSLGSTTTLTLGGNSNINGGSGANEDLTLQGTSNATRTTSFVNLQPNGGFVGVGKSVPLFTLDVNGNASVSGTFALGPMYEALAGTCDASTAGRQYYNGSENKYYYCNGTAWTAMGSGSGTSNWTQDALGVLYPNSQTTDVLIGGTATTSSKFGFTGVDGGLPTASIAGNIANVATYLTGNGNLATTNMRDLTLGGSTTGNVVINSRGSSALTANGANLTAGGTFTLPNSNTLTGIASYVEFNNGIQVDSGNITTTSTTANLFNATATTLNIGGAATTALNIGNGNTAYTAINIGSGTGGNTINIAGTGATGADTINVGTGGTGADTINIGNNASTTAINLTSGTSAQTFTSSVATGTTTTGAFVFNDASLTSGDLIYGNGGGGSFTGNLLKLANNSGIKYSIDSSGNASESGTLTIGNGSVIRPAYGGLNLAYKSGANTWTNDLTLNDNTGDVDIAGGSGSTGCTVFNATGNLTCSGTISGTITATNIPFSGITSGTNTVAAMIVDTGASLTYSGGVATSGVINANQLLGATWAAPGTIGSGTPNTGAFTTLTSSGNSTIGTGASTTNTFGAGASSVNTIGSTTTPGALTLHGATTLDNTASISGILTVGNGVTNVIQSPYGPLVLNYKSGANAWTAGLTLTDTTGNAVIAQNLAVNGGSLTTSQTTANLFNTTATTLNIGGAATVGLNIGVGTAGNIINIATNNSTKDTINIGSALDDVIINGAGTGSLINFANFDVATTGNITVAPGVGLDTNAAGELKLGDATATTVSIGSTAATTLNLGAGGSLARAINIGTGTGADTISIGTGGTGADTITIGNNASTTALNLTSGTGAQTFTSSVATGTGLAGAFVFKDTALSSGDMIYATSSGALTSGNLFKLGTGGNTTFTGNAIYGDLDNTGQGGAGFTGNFLKFDNAGTTKYFLDSAGNASESGTLTLGNGSTIRPAYGPLTLSYKSGANSWATGLIVNDTTGYVGIDKTSPLFNLDVAGSASISATLSLGPMLQIDAGTCNASSAGKEYYDALQNSYYFCNGTTWAQMGSGGGTNYWQLNTLTLSPANNTYDLAVGGTATSSAKFQAFALEKAADATSRLAKLNSSLITTGTLFEATASAITSGNIIKLGQGGDSAFSGNGLFMDFDNTGGGGGTFTGDFLKFNNAGSTKFIVDSTGTLTLTSGDTLANGAAGTITLTPGSGSTETLAVATATTVNLFNTQATTLNLGGEATTALNIGNGNTAYTAINIGSGTGGNTINLAGTGATGADTINIGTGATGVDTITVGNNASVTSLALTSGTGDVAISSTDLITLFPTTATRIGAATTYASFAPAGDVTFVNAGAASSITGSVGGPLTLSGGTGQYSRFGTNTATYIGSAVGDLLVSGDMEINGANLYLNNSGGTFDISDSGGQSTIEFPNDPVTSQHLLNGSWYVNNTFNTVSPALSVNQAESNDIFTAAQSGNTKFVIANSGSVTIRPGDSSGATMLTAGDGTGKIDVGTVDPPYTINGTKYATYLTSMVGVKEEVTGQAQTSEYIPGLGYRNVIDFNNLPEGSDLWLFGKATDIKDNIDQLVALLTPSYPTRVWYDVDHENKRLVIYSAMPTTVSYRLTGPRFDYQNFPNQRSANSDSVGFIINSLDTINSSPVITNVQQMAAFVTQKVQDGVYALHDPSGTIVDGLESIGNFVAANIKAGAIQTQEIAATSLTAFQGSVDNLFRVKLISPLANETDVTVKLGSEATPSGKFAIQDNGGNEVASIDSAGNATFSGTVRSQNIDQIQALLNQVSADQSVLLAATSGANLSASGSANLSQLITSDLFVTNHAAITSLLVDEGLTTGNIDSLSGPLQIQSLAMAPVEIMAGLVTIDTNGNVKIAGNLDVAGKITTPQLDAGIINATGSATLSSVTTPQLVVAASDATEAGTIINGAISTNSTVGKAIIPAGTNEITIKNPKISDYTLVYVTPTSSTQNYVLYVKSKENGQFVVGFDNPLNIDVNFNWWIVQVGQ